MGPTSGDSSDRVLTTGESSLALWQRHGEFELAISLIDLEDFTFQAVSRDFAQMVGLSNVEISGFPALTLFREEERENLVIALTQLREGVVDSYSAHRLLNPAVVRSGEHIMWSRLRAISFQGKPVALSEMNLGTVPTSFRFTDSKDDVLHALVLGFIDAHGQIESVSDNASQIFGVKPESLVGRPFLSPLERQDLVNLHDGKPIDLLEHALAFRLRREGGDEGNVDFCCIISALEGVSGQCFVLVPAEKISRDPRPDRSSVLEEHLWRIAHEILASRIFESFGEFPKESHFAKLGELSGRQMEVLRRLLRGERVQTIASALYVSPSTVRGVLSEIFLVFGVHSQAELLVTLHEDGTNV